MLSEEELLKLFTKFFVLGFERFLSLGFRQGELGGKFLESGRVF